LRAELAEIWNKTPLIFDNTFIGKKDLNSKLEASLHINLIDP